MKSENSSDMPTSNDSHVDHFTEDGLKAQTAPFKTTEDYVERIFSHVLFFAALFLTYMVKVKNRTYLLF